MTAAHGRDEEARVDKSYFFLTFAAVIVKTMDILSKICRFLFGWLRGRDGVMALATFLCLMWFVVDWCLSTTFRSMSDWMLYAVNILAALLLMAPWMLSRRVWLQTAFLALVDILLEANLMYCRTYFTAIPPDSYLLAGNMADFTSSIADSLRPADAGFLIVLAACAVWAYRSRSHEASRRTLRWLALTAVAAATATAGIAARGGFYKAYDKLIQNCYYFTCGVPTYTVAGHVAYYTIENHRNSRLSDADREELRAWFGEHAKAAVAPDTIAARRSLVLIICESLESWPIGAEVDGKPVTPYLNTLVADSTTFYAPKVLTQVCAGHSIDGQLMYTTGLLPTAGFVYSMKYPHNAYPSLNKILKADRGARSTMLTTDKLFTWNQGAVAEAFGYDSIISYDDWRRDELIDRKVSDGSFFRQSVEKLSKGDIWPVGEPAMLTFITISGHNPFALTEELADPGFDASRIDIPETIARYVNVTHYVDSQLHTLIDYIYSRPDADGILTVIVGDHEGLGLERDRARRWSAEGAALVGKEKFVPMIVLNAPAPGRYDGVMGQVDVFPTVLDMLGLRHSPWRGLGASVLGEGKVPAAYTIVPVELLGDTAGVDPAALEHMRRAPAVSERIIVHDLLK